MCNSHNRTSEFQSVQEQIRLSKSKYTAVCQKYSAMAASSVTLSSSSYSYGKSQSIFRRPPPPCLSLSSSTCLLRFQLRIPGFRLQASRRTPNFAQEGENQAVDPRNWSRIRNDMTFAGDYDEDDEEEEEEEEDDRSLDLLIRFVENVFKKISKRARKAVRSVLPVNIPTKLVGFSVNGVIILTFFWILKAFLEVVCTLGSVVFVSILLVRGVWTGISYFQEDRYRRANDFEDDNQAWSSAQPVA